MTPGAGEVDSLFDAIAELLPVHLREHFYRRMAHLQNLAPNDDVLHLAEAMGFLALITRETPSLITSERQRLEAVLTASVDSVRDATETIVAYHRLLDARLKHLPDEIQTGMDPEAIAAALTESLRQRIAQTGLPALAQEINLHASTLASASKQLASALAQFSDPNRGVCQRIHTALSSMQTDLNNAADHVRSLTRTLRLELFTSLVMMAFGAATIGFLLGMVYAQTH